jgi:nicotinate-nucleotide pyrophosphorylase (carboxylating)
MEHQVTPDRRAAIDAIVRRALDEDLADEGDITSRALFAESETASAVITSNKAGVLSGAYLLGPIFGSLDPGVMIRDLAADGSTLAKGGTVCRLSGPIRPILAGERTALNFLQRLSGIATLTARLSAAIAHTAAKLLDTRKTTPGLRLLEKQAVVHGGGTNHRFGLFDMVLIKDTHVAAAGGVAEAVRKSREYLDRRGLCMKLEAEVRTIAEFNEALAVRPDVIMLDNMRVRDMAACVEKRSRAAPGIMLEASGNVRLETIAAIAETGVDFISCGAITHSAPALDIHLVIE